MRFQFITDYRGSLSRSRPERDHGPRLRPRREGSDQPPACAGRHDRRGRIHGGQRTAAEAGGDQVATRRPPAR